MLVDGLYLKLLGRAADPGGRAGLVNFLQNGGTVEQAIVILVTSPEYNVLAGSPAGFVQSLYSKLLGRVASSGEIAAWLSPLRSLGEAAVANAFLSSSEFRGDLVQQLYGFTPAASASVVVLFPNLLHRTASPSAAEVNGWVSSGLDMLTITARIAGSAECFASS